MKLGPCVTRTIFPIPKMSEVQRACSRDILEYAVRKAQDVSVEWPSTFPIFRLSEQLILRSDLSEGDARADNVGRSTYAVSWVRWLHKTRNCTSVCIEGVFDASLAFRLTAADFGGNMIVLDPIEY